MKNPKTINEHFDQKYGKVGTKSRANFKQNAELFLITEVDLGGILLNKNQ
jgi:hypothetical protein